MGHPKLRQSRSVRDVLRLQTNETHQKLHDHSSFVALFKQTMTLDQYRELMLRFYGFYAPLEQAISRVMLDVSANDIGYSYKPRAAFLRQDLIDLGVPRSQLDDAPVCDALLDMVTPHTLGGVLYVIEGSTLGAAPIDRAAQKLLSADIQDGRRFWAWSRAQNGPRWKTTVQYLEHLNETGTPLADLENGANQTFQMLADWLAPLDQPARLQVPA